MKPTYTIEQLQEAVNKSRSIAQCITYLGLNASGNAYNVFKRRIKENNIDISHFKGQQWAKGLKGLPSFCKIPLEEIISGQHPSYGSHRLKNRLIARGYLERKCYCCGMTKWLDQPIPIELEHIDGNSENHVLSNLTILCPNCHAMTATHAGKNKGNSGSDSRT